jgi:hypothetical protein
MKVNASCLAWSDSGSHTAAEYGKVDIEGQGGPCILRPLSLSPSLYGYA